LSSRFSSADLEEIVTGVVIVSGQVGGAPVETWDDPIEASFCHLVTGVVKGQENFFVARIYPCKCQYLFLAKFRQTST
jgi:hypothetical protein